MNLRGDQVINFIEKNLRHTEGEWAGKPFILFDFQKQIIADIYDDRDSQGRRRCTQFYFESAKGNSKSPFITALAIVEFLFNGPSSLVLSLASTFTQAIETTFLQARRLIEHSPTLKRLCVVQEKQIKGPDGCRWIVMSGDGAGKAGLRPTCAVLDELQEQGSRHLLQAVTANMTKLSRRQPLLLVAGNAGAPDTVAADWHERGLRYMAGEDTGGFKAAIYGLAPDDDWHDESRWIEANPALGKIIELDALRAVYRQAKTDPAVEHTFRTLHLGQWIGSSQTGYLDIDAWTRCTDDLPPDLSTMPAWIGVDLSTLDDLTAVSSLWVGPERRIYARCHCWIPQPTAEMYEADYQIPFKAWAKAGVVTITETTTIDHTVKSDIADYIEAMNEKHQLRQVCYDAYRASDIVQRLEQRKIICEPIKPTFEGLSAATQELSRRLRSDAITIEPNECLKWQARNLHVISNSLGDVRPSKAGAKGKYAGTRSMKIDGLTATILAMSRAMRHANALVEPKTSTAGKISYIDD